jgi:hypothetical protein
VASAAAANSSRKLRKHFPDATLIDNDSLRAEISFKLHSFKMTFPVPREAQRQEE